MLYFVIPLVYIRESARSNSDQVVIILLVATIHELFLLELLVPVLVLVPVVVLLPVFILIPVIEIVLVIGSITICASARVIPPNIAIDVMRKRNFFMGSIYEVNFVGS